MHKVFSLLLQNKKRLVATKGANYEEIGVTLGLKNPRFRMSRSVSRQILASCLGELLWYLSGSKDLAQIQYYLSRYDEASDDGKTVHGAYGPRLMRADGLNQIQNIIERLQRKPTTRRAVIQLFEAEDLLHEYNDIPCTCSLQFLLRNNRLNLVTYMRSNDAFVGLPHDIFCFTMIQEIVARSLGVELGMYRHSIGSLHIYETSVDGAKRFINEGFQEPLAMPIMPKIDPWAAITKLKKAEENLRTGNFLASNELKNGVAPYWADLIRILEVWSLQKRKQDKRSFVRIKAEMHSSVYEAYTRKFELRARVPVKQEELPFGD